MIPRPPEGETIYRDHRVSVRRCAVPLRSGGEQIRAVVIHPGAVVVLPITADGRIIFIRNHRWQIGAALLELPAGTCDKPDEPLEAAAARELTEEAGYTAQTLTHLGSMYAAPGGSTEVMHCYLAEGLTWVGQRLEEDERIEVVPLSVDDALARMRAGRLTDMKTVAALGLWRARLA